MNRIEKHTQQIDVTSTLIRILQTDYRDKHKGTIFQNRLSSIKSKFKNATTKLENFGQHKLLQYSGRLELDNIERKFKICFLEDVTVDEVIQLVEHRTKGTVKHLVREVLYKDIGKLIF